MCANQTSVVRPINGANTQQVLRKIRRGGKKKKTQENTIGKRRWVIAQSSCWAILAPFFLKRRKRRTILRRGWRFPYRASRYCVICTLQLGNKNPELFKVNNWEKKMLDRTETTERPAAPSKPPSRRLDSDLPFNKMKERETGKTA